MCVCLFLQFIIFSFVLWYSRHRSELTVGKCLLFTNIDLIWFPLCFRWLISLMLNHYLDYFLNYIDSGCDFRALSCLSYSLHKLVHFCAFQDVPLQVEILLCRLYTRKCKSLFLLLYLTSTTLFIQRQNLVLLEQIVPSEVIWFQFFIWT